MIFLSALLGIILSEALSRSFKINGMSDRRLPGFTAEMTLDRTTRNYTLAINYLEIGNKVVCNLLQQNLTNSD